MEDQNIYMNEDFVNSERNTNKATPGGGRGCPPQARVEANGVTSRPRALILLAALSLILLAALVALGVLYVNKSSQFDLLEAQHRNIGAQLKDDHQAGNVTAAASGAAAAAAPTQTSILEGARDIADRDAVRDPAADQREDSERAADATGCRVCAEGWLLNQGKCFYFSTEKMDWSQSRDHCISLGGHLAIITSTAQQMFLGNHTDNQKYWIGLNDLETEGRWLWVDNTPLNPTGVQFWFERGGGTAEPDNWTGQNPSGENCAILGNPYETTDKWFDVPCENKYKCICQTLSAS